VEHNPHESEYDRLVRDHLERGHVERTWTKHRLGQSAKYHDTFAGRVEGALRDAGHGLLGLLTVFHCTGLQRCSPCATSRASREEGELYADVNERPTRRKGAYAMEEEEHDDMPVAAKVTSLSRG